MSYSSWQGSRYQEALLRAKAEQIKKKAAIRRVERMTRRKSFDLRGNNAVVQEEFDTPTFLVGAAGTGKTLAWCILLNDLLWRYDNSRGLIVRKVRKDLTQSALVTFERDVLGLDNPICSNQQRDNRTSYRYPNGAELVVAGLDRPGAALSAEYDFIYIVEATDFDENDYETLDSRNRNFVAPVQMIFGDANPSHPRHWLKQYGDLGKVRLLYSFHKDNPRYWTGTDWTPEGRIYVLGKLARLSGVRRKRFFEGKWSQAEGAVYEDFADSLHVLDAGRLIEMGIATEVDAQGRLQLNRAKVRMVIASVDWGFTNAGVIQVWAIDGDGRMYLIHEIYMTRKQIAWWVEQAQALQDRYGIERFFCDPAEPAYIDAFVKAGLDAEGADNSVKPGIDAVQTRLQVQDDGLARIYFYKEALEDRDPELVENKKPTCLLDEIPGYVWSDRSKKEEPVKVDDHGADTMRYAAMGAAVIEKKLERLRRARPVGVSGLYSSRSGRGRGRGVKERP